MRPLYRLTKRLADFLFSLMVLALLLPILIAVGLAVRLSSKGSVLFLGTRVGQHGRHFRMWKFRTMIVDADQKGPSITAGDDPRITKIGRFLRLSKLDEIPQFWNVLVGQMSVVGPRPNVPKYADAYEGEAKRLLEAPQGITDYSSLWFRRQEALLSGSANVEGQYEQVVAPLKTLMGVYYVDHASLGVDFQIFLATIAAVFLKIDPIWCFPEELSKGVEELATSLGVN